MATEFMTDVGRLVQGDAFTPQDKDQTGAPRVIKTGPNAGQPDPQYFIAVAFPKMVNGVPNPTFAELYGKIHAEARAGFPHLFQPDGKCVNPNFSFKVIDGDGVDQNGKSNAEKEGFAGHWVVRFASRFAPRVFLKDHYAAHEQVTDKNALKRGYYVRVHGSTVGNNNPQRPGVYMNFDLVEITAYGPEIVSANIPDAATVFGSAPVSVLPPGASAVPLAAPAPAPAMPMGGPTLAPLAAPAPTPSPTTGYPMPMGGPALTPAPSAPAPAPAPAPVVPAAPVRQMTDKANGYSFEALIGMGWTEAQLIEQGLMVA